MKTCFLLAAALAAASGALHANSFYLTVAGLGGEAEYDQRFTGWAKELDKILHDEPGASVQTLSGAEATRANIQAKLAEIAKQAKADDFFTLLLIGHGSFDEADYKFNVPGPDVTATELAQWLDKIPAHELVVDMTSASGGAIPALQKSKRVVIAATKSGTEKNATVFARYWVEALRDPAADTDKNEIITALEAFRYAEGKTSKFYEDLKRLATEHPVMEDTGKGDAVRAATAENGQGLIAGRFPVLHTGSAIALAKNPEKLALLKKKEELEQDIDELKYRKASLAVQEYRQQLAKYLVDLAKTQEALDKMKFLFLALVAAVPILAQPPEAQQCLTLKRHGDPNARACFQRLITNRDPAISAEGFWGLGNFKSANDTFRAAVAAHPKDPGVRTRWGRMFLEHWQASDAADLFNEALAIQEDYAPALLGRALMAGENYEGVAIEAAQKALASDPKMFEAYELIARVTLEDNNPTKATEAAQKALAISPEAMDAMAVLATIDLLADKKDTPWIDRALKVNPRYGNAYAIAAHFFINNRRYEEGIELYQKALTLDTSLMSARSDMGVNLMRLGREDEARKALEECYNGGYQSPETVNSLRLLDSYKDYVTAKTPHGNILRLHKKEAELLRPYFEQEFDRAIDTYQEKYKFKLQRPVQVEVYPNHEDFAVRTVSMPGLGALGVTFGYVVAMDSPSGRTPGEFHWASTMWHELSHVYVLEMTGHKVPRWFTEGLAVYEETGNGHPDWGDRLDAAAINAIKEKKLLPIAELDRGFIHPTYPSQVIVSYFQGGRICTFIAQKWGYDKLLAMIHDFAGDVTTSEVIEKELQVKPEEFDKQFLAWLEPQVEKTVGHFDDWSKRIRALAANAKSAKWDEVIAEGTAIEDFYPEYVEHGSVYEFLSDAYLAKGDKVKAAAELERYSKVGGRDPELLMKLSAMQAEQGRKREAAQTLERLNVIYLEDESAHQHLGDLYLELGNGAGAVREFQAVLAGSKPLDPAGAHFGLARAFVTAKRIPEAREEVISALELAPGLKAAQKLLLELSEKEK